jgi:serine/threonine protein phosphatase PrpC
MASFTDTTREITAAENQLGSKQDITFYYEGKDAEGNPLWIAAILDGHSISSGKNPYTNKYERHNFCVEALKKFNEDGRLLAILSMPITDESNPAIALQHALGEEAKKYRTNMLQTGATLALAQICHIGDKIKVSTLSVGDSTVLIHCNGEQVYETSPHDYTNQAEIARLLQENRFKDPSNQLVDGPNFEFMDDTFIVQRTGKYIDTKKVSLAMTQSIGHLEYSPLSATIVEPLGALGLCPEMREFEFGDTDDINIKVFSDGVSDMINTIAIPEDAHFLAISDAQSTVDFASARWKKEWKYCKRSDYKNGIEAKETIPYDQFTFGVGGMDDTSCVCWIQKK